MINVGCEDDYLPEFTWYAMTGVSGRSVCCESGRMLLCFLEDRCVWYDRKLEWARAFATT